MASEYYEFGKKHFEYELRSVLIKNNLGFLKNITDEWKKEKNSWEYIYSISTKNKSLDVIVFSSVDISTNFVRKNGSDAVRLVFRWKLKNGKTMYKHIKKHYRIKTLFSNIEKTLIEIQNQVFNLKFNEFVESDKELVTS